MELILIVLLPILVLGMLIMDRKTDTERGKLLDTEDLDYHSGTPGVDHAAIALQLYNWLKVRNNRHAISTHHALDKAFGRPRIEYPEGGTGYVMVYADFSLVDYDLLKIDDALMDLIERENEYVADFSQCEDMFKGETYDIPFVFRKNH
ncbi:MAG: hypothetical protein GXY24_00240 [Bacteroidales bacterium]|jgi:hypothetical protein|nr:hypothetical protein [Bacteroidales bacterium]